MPVVRGVLLAPGWSWATTIPIAAVAPVAARIAPRVRLRSRDRAFSLDFGVFGSSTVAMRMEFLYWGRPYPTMLESTPSQ